MAEMLLLNPRGRRKARRAAPAKRRTTAKRRRRNPITRAVTVAAPRRRRRNPMTARAHRIVHHRRRRRNPISLGGRSASIVGMLKEALIGGGGAIAVDLAYGQINHMLPTALQRTPGTAGAGDAVKALLTVLAGKFLSKPTRGLSVKAAQGSLIVQAHGLIAGMLPSTMTLGYAVPGHVVPGAPRIGPNAALLQRYTQPGVTPLLSRFTAPGVSPLLNGSRASVMDREGVRYR
jgi:hypothetical protein